MISSATVRQILVTWNIFSILDRQYTSSLGENLKKLEIIEYTHCMHINSIIPETKSMHLLYLYSNASCSKVWPNDM